MSWYMFLAVIAVYTAAWFCICGFVIEKLSDKLPICIAVCGLLGFAYLAGIVGIVRWDEVASRKDTKDVAYGTVERFGVESTYHRTYYSISLKERPGVIFFSDANISYDLAVTQIGDYVGIGCAEKGRRVIEVTEFRNFTFEDKNKTSAEKSEQQSKEAPLPLDLVLPPTKQAEE